MRSWETTEMYEFTDRMTLAEQIGQLFVVGFAGLTASPELLDLLQREHVGGVIMFSQTDVG
jgi:beta-N-acetylhexosaminidase